MAKTKTDSKKATQAKPVKEGRVSKPSQTPVAKAKEVAKTAVAKIGKEHKKSKKSKKPVKEPTPEPEFSSSESEADDDNESSISSSDSSDDEKEVKKLAAAKVNGKAKPAAAKDDSDSESSESESEDEVKPALPTPAKANGTKKAPANSDSSDSEFDDESAAAPALAGSGPDSSSEDESSDDEDAKPATAKGVKLNGNVKKADAGEPEDSDISSEESESDEEEVVDEPPMAAKKRKAEEAMTPVSKKTKTDNANSGDENPKNLFVGSLSWSVDEDWLAREFEEFGEITGCRVITDRESGRSKGFGYVEFAEASAAAAALKARTGYEIDGRAINVDYSTPKPKDDSNKRAEKYGDKPGNPTDTLFIGNLAFDADNDTIQDAFQEFGTITRVHLVTDRDTGNPKGFGYVGFSDVKEAIAALEGMTGQQVAGRPIRCDYAQPRDNSSGDRGGRGGFGGRGGGRGGFGDRGGFRGGRGGGRGGFGDRGGRGGGRGRGAPRGGRGGSFNRGGFGDFKGNKVSFD